jgi:uncharacterized RDD family membrane protein YckC
MACWLYEGLLSASIALIAGLLAAPLADLLPAEARRYAIQAALFVALGVYFGGFWTRGHTLAMQTWRIRVVDRQGQPLTFRLALRRYVLCWLWLLPPLAALTPFKLPTGELAVLTLGWVAVWALLSRFQPQGQFWHDVWAGTRLIDTRAPRLAQTPVSESTMTE